MDKFVSGEKVERPDELYGKTYVIKPADGTHGIYVTINHMELEDGTTRIWEVFIDTKNQINFEFLVGIGRLLSLAFRKGMNPATVVCELLDVHGPSVYFSDGANHIGYMSHIAEFMDAHIKKYCTYPEGTDMSEISRVREKIKELV